MSEIGSRVRKLRDGYIDWHGRPSTEEAYLAQFKDSPEQVEDAPRHALQPRPLREIEGSGIPKEHDLLDNGVVSEEQLPDTIAGLIQLRGIGKKSAEQIAAWVSDNWGYEIRVGSSFRLPTGDKE